MKRDRRINLHPEALLAIGLTLLLFVDISGCGGSGDGSGGNTVSQESPIFDAAEVKAIPGDKQVTLLWSGVSGTNYYDLYWSTSPEVTEATGTKISNVSSPYTHTGLTNGETYYYTITAVSSVEGLESIQVSATPRAAPDWICVSETSPWLSRDSAGEMIFGDEMWLMGGYTPPLLSDVWHSADGVNWTRAADIPEPAGINLPIHGVVAGKMLIVANNGALYESSDGYAWEQELPIMPGGMRYAAGSIVFNDRLWVLGGYEYKEDESDILHNDVWSSSDGLVWRRETDNAGWEPRQLFNAVVNFNGKLWIIGGGITEYHPFIAYNDVWSSSDGVQWQKELDSAPWEKRIWHSAAVYKNRIWLLGGYHSEPESINLGDVWYSCNGKDWKKLETEHSWDPRHALSVYVYKDRIWVVGGNSWPLKNDVWALDIQGLSFLTPPEERGRVGIPYTYSFNADFNSSCTPISYELVDGPSWVKLDANEQTLAGTPSAPGDYHIKLRAFDGAETVDQDFVISVE